MRRVEGLDDRVNSNIDKTESVISKLRMLDSKIFQNNRLPFESQKTDTIGESESSKVNTKLTALDQKVTDIDEKLNVLKNQLDTNSLQGEDINAEASEKRSVSMNVVEITKALNTEVINHVTKELGQLRETTGDIDKKLQFHITLVQDNLGKVLGMVNDVHHAIIDDPKSHNKSTITTTQKPDVTRPSKIDSLVEQIQPIITVSEKMDEVWNVVVGTKSSVDDLVPKSDELLTQTQRQERAIGEIHNDLRMKTNKIIANLDKVEKRLKKQEDDVATLAQKPVPAEILLEPNLEHIDEYESTRYIEDYATDATNPGGYTTQPPHITETSVQNTVSQVVGPSGSTTTEKRLEKRKGGIIFPSVKNKPTHVNTTFVTADVTSNQKDVKVSCNF